MTVSNIKELLQNNVLRIGSNTAAIVYWFLAGRNGTYAIRLACVCVRVFVCVCVCDTFFGLR